MIFFKETSWKIWWKFISVLKFNTTDKSQQDICAAFAMNRTNLRSRRLNYAVNIQLNHYRLP